MQYNYLGRTGVRVSELCLGAMTFGRETDEATSRQMMDIFADRGGNFIDSANVYNAGESEAIVGRWLVNRRREDFVVATKVRYPMGDGVNDAGLSRAHIVNQVDGSLRRLQTDYIDLYQVHAWDPGTPLDETMHALDRLVQDGKVRAIGVSNFTGWQLQKAIDISKYRGWARFVCLQPLYNLLDRSFEWELRAVCQNEQLAVIPWSPLRGGWLTGKYHRDMQQPPDETRLAKAEKQGWSERWSVYNTERTWQVIDELLAVAEEADKHPAQVALRWLLQRPAVTAPIVGARTIEQLETNLGAAGWSLDNEQMARLTAASEMELPYPYDIMQNVAESR